MSNSPRTINSVETLEEMLSRPTPAVVDMMKRIDGDILFLGAGGKMGPTMARMAKRAIDEAGVDRKIIAASRYSNPEAETSINAHGIETIRCDLLEAEQVAKLPKCPNVIYMAGMKFGATGQQPLTWAMNAWLPTVVSQHFAQSRIAAFSTGNVYGLSPLTRGGCIESDPLDPVGEYAMSCLGRERMFEYFAERQGTSIALIRLNYATEMRYGVLVDVAQRVFDGKPIDLAMGTLNSIWQGDANAHSLLALNLASSPASHINVAGPEQISVRRVAEYFAAYMNKELTLEGEEADTALLSNAQRSHDLWGYPSVSLAEMLEWIANWIMVGGASLNKPTGFENRAGDF
jgi:nucleoside-diphosphate-sugar epimerase